MKKALKNERQVNAANALLLLGIFLAEAILCWFFTNTHDDYLTAGLKTVAEAWGNNKIQTWNDLDLYYQKQEKLMKIKN